MRKTDKQSLDLSAFQVRTDLAVEARQMALDAQKEADQDSGDIEGVLYDEFEEDGIKIIKVHIQSDQGAKRVGKQKGRYLTLEAKALRTKDSDFQDKVTTVLANQFYQFLLEVGISLDAKCLVVGWR